MNLLQAHHRRQLRVGLGILGAVVLGAALRLIGLGATTLRGDEYATYMFAREPLRRLWGPDGLVETNPPLYYTLQRGWLLIAGDEPGMMRLLPVFFGLAALPVMYALGRRLFGPWGGVLCTYLLASAPFHVLQSRECRGYSMLMLATLIGLLALAYLLPPRLVARVGARPVVGAARAYWWCAYVAGASIAIYAHNTAVLFPFLMCVLIAGFWATRCVHTRFVMEFVAANAAAFAITLWWLLRVWHQTRTLLPDFWIEPFALKQAYGQILRVYSYEKWAKAVIFVLAALGLWSMRRRRGLTWFVLLPLLGQPVLVALLSLKWPMFIARVLAWPSSLFYVLLATGVVKLSNRRARFASGAALLAIHFAAFRQPLLSTHVESDLVPLVARLSGFNPRTDWVVVAPMGVAEWEFTYESRRVPLRERVIGVADNDRHLQIEIWEQARRVNRAEVSAHVKGARQVWYFQYVPAIPQMPSLARVETNLRALARHEQAWVSGSWRLVVFDLNGTDDPAQSSDSAR